MFKTALFDCSINEKCCSVDRVRGICPRFSSSPYLRQKKNADSQGSARWGGGGLGGWVHVELTDA